MNILRITSSPRKGYSKSMQLGEAIIEKLLAVYPDSAVKHKDLTLPPFPHLEQIHLNAFYMPTEHQNAEYLEAARPSNEAIAEIKEADILVVEAPLYNLTISSTLKAWIDHIVRGGITFQHTPEGDIGLLSNKKVYLAIAAGYVYSEGPYKGKNFVAPLLENVFNMIGITDITIIIAEGLSVSGMKETALQKAIDSVHVSI